MSIFELGECLNWERKRRKSLERALRGLLAVAWPNEDKQSRTSKAIRAAEKALKQ